MWFNLCCNLKIMKCRGSKILFFYWKGYQYAYLYHWILKYWSKQRTIRKFWITEKLHILLCEIKIIWWTCYTYLSGKIRFNHETTLWVGIRMDHVGVSIDA